MSQNVITNYKSPPSICSCTPYHQDFYVCCAAGFESIVKIFIGLGFIPLNISFETNLTKLIR